MKLDGGMIEYSQIKCSGKGIDSAACFELREEPARLSKIIIAGVPLCCIHRSPMPLLRVTHHTHIFCDMYITVALSPDPIYAGVGWIVNLSDYHGC